jgi:DNA (cytosine-5)-methyltransferase 1
MGGNVFTLTDFFCGGGGSSVGAMQVPGVQVTMAANHWRTAIDVHQENHPDARHDCADISQVDPRRYPTTDGAWFSPSCTKHSIAQGAAIRDDDDSAERSRATMWDVHRFTEYHRYRFIWVENVIEVRKWRGFRAWRIAMDDEGYCLHEVSLNAAHASQLGAPAGQWRDRWFCLMHPKGTTCPDTDAWIAPKANCRNCGPTTGRQSWKSNRVAGKYRTQYTYRCRRCAVPVSPLVRPARSLIDWQRPAPSIGSRTRPLAEKTLRRIRIGAERYGTAFVPVEGRDGKQPFDTGKPFRTVTTRNETGVVIPPFIAELRGGSSTARPVSEPLSTVCASGNHHGLVIPQERTDIREFGFRMIDPFEYARFQHFPDSYRWFEDRISKRHRVRMIGNAVPTSSARDLIACGLESVGVYSRVQ